jgi:hypothetical protein
LKADVALYGAASDFTVGVYTKAVCAPLFFHHKEVEPRVLGQPTDSWVGTGKEQQEPGTGSAQRMMGCGRHKSLREVAPSAMRTIRASK